MASSDDSTGADIPTGMLPALKADLTRWEKQKAHLEARISARHKLIDALEAEAALNRPGGNREEETLFPAGRGSSLTITTGTNGNGSQPSDKPTTGDAALRVLTGADKPLSKAEVFDGLVSRGWAPTGKNPRAALGSALWYLHSKHLIKKLGDNHDTKWAPLKDFASPEGDAKESIPDHAEGVMS